MHPTFRTVGMFAVIVPATLILVLLEEGYWVYGAALLVVAISLCGADILMALPRRCLTVDTITPSLLYIGESGDLTVDVSINESYPTIQVECLLKVGETVNSPESVFADVQSGVSNRFSIPVTPNKRGKAFIHRIWTRWEGPFQLFVFQVANDIDQEVPVVPNTMAVKRSAVVLATRNNLIGNKTQQQHGEGSEFSALREYVPGLDPRAIDWNQSARHRKLICAEYEVERNHQIILAMDTGRLMAEPVDGISRLDHAINAGLLLAYNSLRSGDRVGLYAFDSKVRQLARPVGGVGNFAQLQKTSAELESVYDDTNFTLGLMHLLGELNRRTLIILQTDFVDTVTAEIMLENITRLSARHLVLFVTISDPSVVQDTDVVPTSNEDVARAVVANDIANERKVVFEKLRRLGVLCLEAPREDIGIELVNQYLTVKHLELI